MPAVTEAEGRGAPAASVTDQSIQSLGHRIICHGNGSFLPPSMDIAEDPNSRSADEKRGTRDHLHPVAVSHEVIGVCL